MPALTVAGRCSVGALARGGAQNHAESGRVTGTPARRATSAQGPLTVVAQETFLA
jgi:hypothetical protein